MINLDAFLNKWLLIQQRDASIWEFINVQGINKFDGDEFSRYWWWGLHKNFSSEPSSIILAKADFAAFDFVADDFAKYLSDIPEELSQLYQIIAEYDKIPTVVRFAELCQEYNLAVNCQSVNGKIVDVDNDYIVINQFSYAGIEMPYQNKMAIKTDTIVSIRAVYNTIQNRRADDWDRVKALNNILDK